MRKARPPARVRPTGSAWSWSICSAGKTVAKGVARARLDGVNTTPIGFFRDSPGWTNDASVKSYIDTCQATKVGDAISQTYLNGILTASHRQRGDRRL